jgi:hypothetical protein
MFHEKVQKKMSKTNRLFIFAAYDPIGLGIVDDTLLIYLKELHKLGDVVFFMDNDASESELDKTRPYAIHAGAGRHGEYDFGSYKRGYVWARDNLDLSDYDWIYMANDSVYAPLHPLRPVIEKLESIGTDATGMMCNPNSKHPHIQSWFVGISPKVFDSPWFDAFIRGIARQPGKGEVTYLYEQGFTRLLEKNGLPWKCAYTIWNRGIYNRVRSLFARGFPFMKKSTLSRHGGALGAQILHILNRMPPEMKNAVVKNAAHVHGREYISWLLTGNPFKIAWRNTVYFLRKIFSKGV